MKPWNIYCTSLVLAAGFAPVALAQGLPAITPPPGVAIAPQPPPVNAPVPPAALPPNIWDKLMPRADQCAACKAKICNSGIGKLLNNMLAPAGSLTGGIIGPCCPTINAADLVKPPDSAEGAAARLKLDEADAAARREAIRYMAGADCHYWPEVQDALIGALRADRNECVRREAALALGRGCCCSRATMMALTLTVSGGTADGNPPEDSECVKEAALAALNHCLSNYTEVVPAPEPTKRIEGGEPLPPKEGEPLPPPVPKPGGSTETPAIPNKLPGATSKPAGPTDFYHHPENLQEKKVVEEARRAAGHVAPIGPEAPSPVADHSLFGIIRAAATTSVGPDAPAEVVMDKPEHHAAVLTEQPAVHGPVAPAMMIQAPKPTPAPPPTPAPSAVAPAAYSWPSGKMTTAPPAAASVASAKTIPVAPAPAPVVLKPVAVEQAVPGAPSANLAPAASMAKPAPAVPAALAAAAPPAASSMTAAAVANELAVLRDSIFPEERAKAAEALGGCDGWTASSAVHALVEAARIDGSPEVRAACLRSLSRLNVRTPPVVAVARELKTDPDQHVRTEAERILK